jgi:hypothetical protein
MDKFLNRYSPPKLNQEETENLSKPEWSSSPWRLERAAGRQAREKLGKRHQSTGFS